jgi:hypothetical protein
MSLPGEPCVCEREREGDRTGVCVFVKDGWVVVSESECAKDKRGGERESLFKATKRQQ